MNKSQFLDDIHTFAQLHLELGRCQVLQVLNNGKNSRDIKIIEQEIAEKFQNIQDMLK